MRERYCLLYLEMTAIAAVSFFGMSAIQAVHSQYIKLESVALH